MKFVKIFDYKVVNSTYEELMSNLYNRIINKEKTRVFAINPEKIMIAESNEEVKRLLKGCEILIPDGIGVVKAAEMFGTPIKGRLTGVDTFLHLLELAEKKSLKVYIYGASEKVNELARKEIMFKFGAIVSGYSNGYEDPDKVLKDIKKSKSDILFVALGSPKQELFMEENFADLNVSIMQGIGGSLDVISGQVKRAPKWVQSMNLEWLHRLILNPSRIWRQKRLFEFYKKVNTTKKEMSVKNVK